MASAALALTGLAAAAAAADLDRATLTVRVLGARSEAGQIKIAVCDRGFDPAGCPQGGSKPPRLDGTEFEFESLPAGRYAIAAYHDVDGNGRLDTMLGGLPIEPYGFSNDVGRFAIPRFAPAQIEVGPGRTVVVIQLHRLPLPAAIVGDATAAPTTPQETIR